MLDLLVGYLLRNSITVFVLSLALLTGRYYLQLQFEQEKQLEEIRLAHELDKMKLENEHKLNMEKLEKDQSLKEKQLELQYQLKLSEAERRFTMENDMIKTVCQDYTKPKQELHHSWWKKKIIWDRPEMGMEQCVHFLRVYIDAIRSTGCEESVGEGTEGMDDSDKSKQRQKPGPS